MKIGDKFRGKINNELFEIVDEYTRNGRIHYKIKHIKSGKIQEVSRQYITHLLIEEIESEANANESKN